MLYVSYSHPKMTMNEVENTTMSVLNRFFLNFWGLNNYSHSTLEYNWKQPFNHLKNVANHCLFEVWLCVFLPNDVCSLLRHFYLKLHSFSNQNLIVVQQFSDGDRWLCNAQIWCVNIVPDKESVITLPCTISR